MLENIISGQHSSNHVGKYNIRAT